MLSVSPMAHPVPRRVFFHAWRGTTAKEVDSREDVKGRSAREDLSTEASAEVCSSRTECQEENKDEHDDSVDKGRTNLSGAVASSSSESPSREGQETESSSCESAAKSTQFTGQADRANSTPPSQSATPDWVRMEKKSCEVPLQFELKPDPDAAGDPGVTKGAAVPAKPVTSIENSGAEDLCAKRKHVRFSDPLQRKKDRPEPRPDRVPVPLKPRIRIISRQTTGFPKKQKTQAAKSSEKDNCSKEQLCGQKSGKGSAKRASWSTRQ